MKKTLLSLLLSVIFGISAVFASWYTDHIKPGSNLYLFDIQYPYWPESTYFACWNINLSPLGGYFYGGVSSPKDQTIPGGVWSFWEHPAYQKRQVKNIYTAPYVYTKQYIGEGASGSAGSPSIPFIKTGHWYTMALRIWTPAPNQNESHIGWWIKDKQADKWHLYGVFSVPYQANGFEKNSGFLEDFGHNGRNKRAILRGAGYCMKQGMWYPADTLSISIAQDTGTNSQRWLVESQDHGRALSIQHSQNINIERNLEPGMTHHFRIEQPAAPTLDKPQFTASVQKCGDNLLVEWLPTDHSSPHLSYQIEVFEKNRRIHLTQEYLPFARQKAIQLPRGVRCTSVKITITDIFNQQQSITLDRITPAKSIKSEFLTSASLIHGVNYRLYTFDTPISSVAELPQGHLEASGRIDNVDMSIRGKHDSTFGAVYQGYIQIPEDNLYSFKLKSCDGSLLKIAGQEVINNDSIHSTSERRGAVFLTKGYHRYQIAYFKNKPENDYIDLSLEWACGNNPFTAIDNNQLFIVKDAQSPSTGIRLAEAGNRLWLSLSGPLDEMTRVVYFCNGKELEQLDTPPFEYLTFPVRGSNNYKARIYDRNHISSDTPQVHYTGTDTTSPEWSYATIGEEHLPHKFGYDNGVFTVSGEGEYQIYKTVRGDFEISGYVEDFKQLESVVERENWIGLMAKRKLAMDNDNDIALFHTSTSGLRSSADFSDYATTRMSSFRMNPAHRWLKISRRGNLFTTYSSPDGKIWTEGLQRALPMPEELYVGITYLSTPGNTNSLFYGSVKNITLQTDCKTPPEQERTFEIPSDCNVLGYSMLDSTSTAVRCKEGLKLIASDNRVETIRLPACYPNVRSVAASPEGLLVVATDSNNQSTLFRSCDKGANWQKLLDGFKVTYPAGVYGEIVTVDPEDANHIVVGSSGEGIYDSSDGGKTWKRTLHTRDTILEVGWNPVVTNMCSLLTLSDQGEGAIYLSYDRGASWKKQISVQGAEFRHLLFDRRVDNLFYINSTRGIYTSFTHCRTLNRIMVHLPGQKAYFASDGVVINLMRHFAIPVDGSAIYRSDVDQLFWSHIPVTEPWGVVFGLNINKRNNRTMRVFTQKGIYRSDDYGVNWECITPLP